MVLECGRASRTAAAQPSSSPPSSNPPPPPHPQFEPPQFHLIDAMGSLAETQEQIEKELRYQSSLDLSEDAYGLICDLPLARDLQQQVCVGGWGVGGRQCGMRLAACCVWGVVQNAAHTRTQNTRNRNQSTHTQPIHPHRPASSSSAASRRTRPASARSSRASWPPSSPRCCRCCARAGSPGAPSGRRGTGSSRTTPSRSVSSRGRAFYWLGHLLAAVRQRRS